MVAYLLDDEGIGAPCLAGLHAALCQLCRHIPAQIVDVLCLRHCVTVCLHRMEVAVYECLTFLQVAPVEDVIVCKRGLALLHFLEMLGMDTADGDAKSADIHHETAVTVNAYDVAFQPRQLTGGDAQQDAVAGIVVIGMEQEADALRRYARDAHEWAHLRVGYPRDTTRAAVLAEVGAREIFIEIGLDVTRIAFDEDESTHGGHLTALHTPYAILSEIVHGLVHETGLAVFLQPLFHVLHHAAVTEEVGPCGAGTFFPLRAKPVF